jgi:uncharacterized protein involved in response to NO
MLKIEPPSATAGAEVPSAFALWALGFRPFYFVAAVFASLSVLLWALSYAGVIAPTYLRDPLWHGHEMLFGYTIAVIAGFLFTAVRNWTGKPTPAGGLLAALVLLWIAGRVLVLTPYAISAAIANAAFPIAVAIAIAVPLAQSGNKRNYFFVALLVVVGIATLALHLSYRGIVAWPARASLQVGLDIVLFIMAVMGGRVIPMFTNNGVPGTNATRKPWLEKIALGGVLVLLAADVVDAPSHAIAVIALIAAIAHGARLALWQSWRTLGTPIVWILHAAYAWIVVYLLLRALAAIGLVSPPLAVHALTIGAIGGLTIGMITRTARGHTGRVLVADRFEVACYVLVQLAAIVRVFGGLFVPDVYVQTVVVSAICWSAAFAIYAVRYWPILSRSRIDGKPG